MRKRKHRDDPSPSESNELHFGQEDAPEGASLQDIADTLGKEQEEARRGGHYTEEIKRLEQIVKDQEAKIAEQDGMIKSLVAENRNQKSRIENEFRTKLVYALEGFFKEFLVIRDDFEKALSYLPEYAKDSPIAAFADGIRHLESKIDSVCRKFGLEGFESIDTPFDPNLHQAIKMVDDPERDANTVAKEYAKGYKYRDRVLRPAMVEVATGNKPGPEKDGDPNQATRYGVKTDH